MVPKKDLVKKGEYEFEIPKQGEMLVPGKIFASEKILEQIEEDCIKQIENVAKLPGIMKHSIGLPDMHLGYGFPIGGVAGFDSKEGIITPGGIGFDINCSVRLLRTNLKKEDLKENKKKVAEQLDRKIPSGMGRGSPFQISKKEFNKLLEGGAKYLVDKGYGKKEDYKHMEEEGCMEGADSGKVSERAIKRGVGQLGTLGSGNHFLDVQVVEEIFDKETARAFGLEENQVVIMIHCGSRGLGHQVASDYMREIDKEFNHILPDKQLDYAPIKSELGKDYYSAMCCAANFAFANKQLITHWVREEMRYIFPEKEINIDVVYDVCHNIAKFEKHNVGGADMNVCVHRKGATRALGKGRKEIPKDYRDYGQPVLIPGSMGTASYVLTGTKKAEELTFGSTVHGAGRAVSRKQAMKDYKYEDIIKDMEKKGIIIKAKSKQSIEQENSKVYKDIDEVVKSVHEAGISKRVAKLRPEIVIIG